MYMKMIPSPYNFYHILPVINAYMIEIAIILTIMTNNAPFKQVYKEQSLIFNVLIVNTP